MRIVLELLRILIIFCLLGSIMGGVTNYFYSSLGLNENNWLVGFSILLLLFVLYRNKLQFTGYYKGEGREKLSKPVRVSVSLISFSVAMLIVAPFFH